MGEEAERVNLLELIVIVVSIVLSIDATVLIGFWIWGEISYQRERREHRKTKAMLELLLEEVRRRSA